MNGAGPYLWQVSVYLGPIHQMASLSLDQYDLMIWYRICYLWKLRSNGWLLCICGRPNIGFIILMWAYNFTVWWHIALPITIACICKQSTPSPTQKTKFMGPTWSHLGPVGPRLAPCWPREPCYHNISGIVPVNGLASVGISTYIRTMMTKFASAIYTGPLLCGLKNNAYSEWEIIDQDLSRKKLTFRTAKSTASDDRHYS